MARTQCFTDLNAVALQTPTPNRTESLLMACMNMQNYPSPQMLGILYTHFHIRLNCFDILVAGGDERAV
jgi:hypothetical protein